MTLDGTVVNGRVVFDGPDTFPEGMRVRVAPAAAGNPADTPTPPGKTYEEHLGLLRRSITAANAGERGLPLAEAMAELDAELDRLAAEARG